MNEPLRISVGTRTDLFLIRNFLSLDECASLIRESEQRGYEEAAISTPFGQVLAKDVRNNDRILWDDPVIASEWWERCKGFVPAVFGNWHAYGLNERFRFYRYKPGQTFKKHQDGSYRRGKGDESWWTLMVYLNSDFSGGRTRFWFAGDPSETAVTPETGMALVFMHERTHEGELVSAGIKYVLRTDVMYRKI